MARGLRLARVALAGAALATAPAAVEAQDAAPEAPAVELEQLFKLPSSQEYSIEKRAGLTRGEWRSRFERVRGALEHERSALAAARARLEEKASDVSAWQIAPPIPGAGAAAADAPVDFQLRQEIRRHREAIRLLEAKLQGLGIEADLAGVPRSWRRPPDGTGGGGVEAEPAPEDGDAVDDLGALP